MSSLEVRIPIGLTDSMINRVRLIAESIHSFDERIYKEASITVFIGADRESEDLEKKYPWSVSANIHWEWVNREEFKRWANSGNPNIAPMTLRFKPPFFGDYQLFLDADVLPIRPFNDLFVSEYIQALPAHAPPSGGGELFWERLYQKFGLQKSPRFWQHYSGEGIMGTGGKCPPYFNTGVVFGAAKSFEAIWPEHERALEFLSREINSYFIDQIALTLAMEVQQVPYWCFPLRYNFPNQREFDLSYPKELENCVFLHYLRFDRVNRDTAFHSIMAMKELVLRKDLTGSNEVLRRRVEELLPRIIDA